MDDRTLQTLDKMTGARQSTPVPSFAAIALGIALWGSRLVPVVGASITGLGALGWTEKP